MTVATTALLVVILAGLLPNGFLRPQGAMAEVPVVPLKPDCGTDGNAPGGQRQRLVVAASWEGSEQAQFREALERFAP